MIKSEFYESMQGKISETCAKYLKQDKNGKIHCYECPYGCTETYECLFTEEKEKENA